MPPTFRRKRTKTCPFTPYVFFPLPFFVARTPYVRTVNTYGPRDYLETRLSPSSVRNCARRQLNAWVAVASLTQPFPSAPVVTTAVGPVAYQTLPGSTVASLAQSFGGIPPTHLIVGGRNCVRRREKAWFRGYLLPRQFFLQNMAWIRG